MRPVYRIMNETSQKYHNEDSNNLTISMRAGGATALGENGAFIQDGGHVSRLFPNILSCYGVVPSFASPNRYTPPMSNFNI